MARLESLCASWLPCALVEGSGCVIVGCCICMRSAAPTSEQGADREMRIPITAVALRVETKPPQYFQSLCGASHSRGDMKQRDTKQTAYAGHTPGHWSVRSLTVTRVWAHTRHALALGVVCCSL
jgi:hypothetical protein